MEKTLGNRSLFNFQEGGKMCNSAVKNIEQKLKQPFARKDVEFRIAKVNKKTRKAYVLAYISSRAAMDRLDAVLGQDSWFDEYEVLAQGVTCRLSIALNGKFITKQDAASFTNIEALKGAFSDALKRAAVKFGIGRYLYHLPDYHVLIKTQKPVNSKNKIHCYYSEEFSGFWVEPDLPDWALPEQEVKQQTEITLLQAQLQDQLKELFETGAITAKKRDEYFKKISDATIPIGLLRYFEKQFDLISKLYSLTKDKKISSEQKSEFYRKIMSSRMKGLSEVESSFSKLEAA